MKTIADRGIMASMTEDLGELLFERYLVQHGGEILAHEPDLGTPKRPDYLVPHQSGFALFET